jgi:uncharacterized protein
MLISFSVANFRSFKEKQTFSLLPANLQQRTIQLLDAPAPYKVKAVPTAVIYGANNSGKTNLILVFSNLIRLIQNSGNFTPDKNLNANQFFALNVQNLNKPTEFEINFIAPNQKRYFYKPIQAKYKQQRKKTDFSNAF